MNFGSLSGFEFLRLLPQNSKSCQPRNLVDGVSCVPQHHLRMLTDGRGTAGCSLRRSVEAEWARHGETPPIGDGDESADLAGLPVVCRFVDREDGAKGYARPFENRTPFRQVTFREDIIQDRGKRDGVLAPR